MVVHPDKQIVELMLDWATAGFVAPGVRRGSGSTAPEALTISAPVLPAGVGAGDELDAGVVRVAELIEGAATLEVSRSAGLVGAVMPSEDGPAEHEATSSAATPHTHVA